MIQTSYAVCMSVGVRFCNICHRFLLVLEPNVRIEYFVGPICVLSTCVGRLPIGVFLTFHYGPCKVSSVVQQIISACVQVNSEGSLHGFC